MKAMDLYAAGSNQFLNTYWTSPELAREFALSIDDTLSACQWGNQEQTAMEHVVQSADYLIPGDRFFYASDVNGFHGTFSVHYNYGKVKAGARFLCGGKVYTVDAPQWALGYYKSGQLLSLAQLMVIERETRRHERFGCQCHLHKAERLV